MVLKHLQSYFNYLEVGGFMRSEYHARLMLKSSDYLMKRLGHCKLLSVSYFDKTLRRLLFHGYAVEAACELAIRYHEANNQNQTQV